ncbi:hypothetical protein [Klebsiella variicola]
MKKEHKNTQQGEEEPQVKSMQFPLESFLKKLKEAHGKKLRQTQRNNW